MTDHHHATDVIALHRDALRTLAPPVTQSFGRDVHGGALVVVNPAAAGVTAAMIDDLVELLQARQDRVTVAWTTSVGEATDLAARSASDDDLGLIVAVGGDGTVREVSQGLASWTGCPSGVDESAHRLVMLALPAGSGNSTALNFWGEAEWRGVVDAALDPARSRVRTIDLLHVVEADRVAVLGASSGFIPAALVAARDVVGLRGLDRYYAAAASVLAAMPAHSTVVRVDGVTVHDGPSCLAAIGGGRYRARSCKFLPLSVLDDGLLDICVMAELSGPALADVAVLALSGEHIGRPDVTYCTGRRVTIERSDGGPLLAEYDGEVWEPGGPTMTIEVLPSALAVLTSVDAPGG